MSQETGQQGYWVDDDGYILHSECDECTVVSGVIDSLHIEPLTKIIDNHDDLQTLLEEVAVYIATHPSKDPATGLSLLIKVQRAKAD